ncbi:MAG: hypothetical protein R3C68_16415 [Myxococcota bacterium]
MMLATTPKKITSDAIQNIRARIENEVKTQDPYLAPMQMQSIAKAEVDKLSAQQVYSPLDKAGMVAQGLSAAKGDLKGPGVSKNVLNSVDLAAHQAAQKEAILRQHFETLDRYVDGGAGNVTAHEMADVFAILGGLGPVMGMDKTHDAHYALAIGNTAIGNHDDVQDIDGQTVHIRETHLPAEEALQLAQTKNEDGKPNNAKLLKIVAETGGGIYAAMKGMVHATGGTLPARDSNFRDSAKNLSDPMAQLTGSLAAWPKVEQRLERIGFELAKIQFVANSGDEGDIRQAFF